MQLIPARGRLLAIAFEVVADAAMQLIPARGRLHSTSRVRFPMIVDAAYPREGTVTLLRSHDIQSTYDAA